MAYYTPYQNQYHTQLGQMYAPQIQTPAQNNQGSLIWVQGIEAAKSYMVAPNTTVLLMDSESQKFYLKSSDASGMPSIKTLDYTIRDSLKNSPNTAPVLSDDKLSTFATKDEIKAVSEQITALRDRVDNLTRKRRREDEDE